MTRKSHRNLLLSGLVFVIACLAGCDSFATDKSRFISPDKPIKSPARSPINPILPSLSPADAGGEILPNSTFPGPDDWTYSDRDYVIGPTDVLDISILDLYSEGLETTVRREVSASGYIDLPQLPVRLKAEGLTKDQLRAEIEKAYSPKILKNPSVSVTVAAARQSTFSILGAIARPGAYPVMRRDMRLLDALALAGDVSQTNIEHLYVIRQAPPARKSTTQPGQEGAASGKPLSASELPPLPELPEEKAAAAQAQSQPASTQPVTQPVTQPATTDIPTKRGGTVADSFPRPWPTTTAANDAAVPPVEDTPKQTGLGGATTQPASEPAEPADQVAPASAGARMARWVYRNGKWVEGKPAPPPVAQAATAAPAAPAEPIVAPRKPTVPLTGDPNDPFGWKADDGSKPSRLIAVSVEKLKAGDPRMNIVIRDNDIIQVPMLQVGEFYVMGEVSRPGVYSLTGRHVTVKQALAAAGNLGPLAWPKNSVLVRRIANHQEQTIPLDLEAICRGDQPDIFLKPDDVLAVGTDVRAPFLAVLRNAFRMTYGFGFIYDRNFSDPLLGLPDSKRFTRL